MPNSDSLSIRLPKDLKDQMKKTEIDWSEYIRNAIEEKIKHDRRIKASRSIDKIRNKTKYGTFDSTKSIREDRDA